MKLIKIKGIQISLHFSTLVIIALVGFSAADFYRIFVPDASFEVLVLFGLLSGIGILGSIIAHELMHSLTAIRNGLEITEIELFLFGGVSKISSEPKHPNDEIKIAFYGPLTSLSIGGLALAIAFLPIQMIGVIRILALYMGVVNIMLGLFNLLPGFPMDGGRILRAIVWKKRGDMVSATNIAAKVGQVIGYGFMTLGFIQILFGNFGGLWQILIGNYLKNGAKQSYLATALSNRLGKIPIENMFERTDTISAMMPLEDATRYFALYRKAFFFVEHEEKLIGILPYRILASIPPINRRSMYVANATIPLDKIPSIQLGLDPLDIMAAVSNSQIGVVKVVDPRDQRILGYIDEFTLQSSLYFQKY
jgi:Zn-dependent protease